MRIAQTRWGGSRTRGDVAKHHLLGTTPAAPAAHPRPFYSRVHERSKDRAKRRETHHET